MQVAIIEDDTRYRGSLELLLEHSPDLTCAGSYPTAESALAAIARGTRWDLALLDIDFGEHRSGIEAAPLLKQALPGARIVMLTVFEDADAILQAICAGADGYLLKKTPAPQILDQVRAVAADAPPLTAGVARTLLALVRTLGADRAAPAHHPRRLQLTNREIAVLRCLVDGLGYQDTAARLDIRIDTVRTHIRNLYRKLQVGSAAEAVARALRERLI